VIGYGKVSKPDQTMCCVYSLFTDLENYTEKIKYIRKMLVNLIYALERKLKTT